MPTHVNVSVSGQFEDSADAKTVRSAVSAVVEKLRKDGLKVAISGSLNDVTNFQG